MRKSLIFGAMSLVWLMGCGTNRVEVTITGGDGNPVRLDANEVQFKFNHLGPAATHLFPTPNSDLKIESGTYHINVAASGYLATDTLTVESPPITGKRVYKVSFHIPPGKNGKCKCRGTIVYAASPARTRNWDLFTIQADGTDRRRLTDTREFEQHPRWSPDGKHILFTQGDVMSNIDIWVMEADGSHRHRLTEHPERDQRATWSPDGKHIAFVSQRDGDVAIWIMEADGSHKHKLTKGREPAYSPDGRRIVFTSGQFQGWDEIYVIDVTGENLQRLTFDKGKFDMFPAWSPDGSRIVFDSERFGGQELMLMLPDGSGQTRITVAEHTFESEPVWSPDGLAVAYSGKMNLDSQGHIMTDKVGRPVGSPDIYIVGAAGFDWDNTADRHVLPRNLTRTPDWEEVSPSWRAY